MCHSSFDVLITANKNTENKFCHLNVHSGFNQMQWTFSATWLAGLGQVLELTLEFRIQQNLCVGRPAIAKLHWLMHMKCHKYSGIVQNFMWHRCRDITVIITGGEHLLAWHCLQLELVLGWLVTGVRNWPGHVLDTRQQHCLPGHALQGESIAEGSK